MSTVRSLRGQARRMASWICSLTLVAIAFGPSAALATTTNYPQNTALVMSGSGITLTILGGSKSDSLSVTATTFAVTVASGDTFTVRYPAPSPGTLANNGGFPSCNLVNGNNDVAVAGPVTVTFTPNATLCAGGSGNTTPSIALSQPLGGQTLTAGSTYQISWSTGGNGITATRISLSTDGGSTYPTVITSSGTNGLYSWSVPNTPTTTARILVEGLVSGSVGATSSSLSNFTIVSAVSSGGGGGAVTALPSTSGSTQSSDDGTNDGLNIITTSATGANAMLRQDADGHLPAAFHSDSLVKLACAAGATDVNDACRTIYYIGLDAKRHSFGSLNTFLSWYPDFSDVLTIDAATLASIPLGKPIMVRPGTFWVKITSDPKTYYVEPGNKLRWIADEATAVTLGGSMWNKNIVDVDPSLFTNYLMGASIASADLASGWPRGAVVKSPSDSTLWYVSSTSRRPFMTTSAFAANKFQSRFVEAITVTGWQALSSGSSVNGLEDALFSLQH